MAVRAFTTNPAKLMKSIREEFEEGRISNWSIDHDGDLTYNKLPWIGRAWMRPLVSEDRVTFYILGNKTYKMSKSTYAFYHGRLIEMLLKHFDNYFLRVSSTANAIRGDIIDQQNDDDD